MRGVAREVPYPKEKCKSCPSGLTLSFVRKVGIETDGLLSCV